MAKRVFLIVLDSFGIGGAPDAAKFGDEGSNTLAAVLSYSNEAFPNLAKMGLLAIDGEDDPRILNYKKAQETIPSPIGSYARVREISAGKDSTIGHWEIAGIISDKAQPTYPDGFPEDVMRELEKATGKEFLCNKPYSGTDVIRDFGEEHMKTGKLIIYTSADSVLQIAAHEEVVPLEELYDVCKKAREVMCGDNAVGRVIARPFVGEPGNFTRTANRHDFSLAAPSSTMLDLLKSEGFEVISIGKIYDLFAGRGLTESNPTKGNTEGISKTIEMMDRDFNGLCFTNLVDFDMKYGHRNNIEGYNTAMHEFDDALGTILSKLKEDDLLIITADHGCDPSTTSTDHSRECIPLLIYGDGYKIPSNMGELTGFNNIAGIVLSALMSRSYKRDFCPAADTNKPDPDNIMSYVDLTNLKTTATTDDIKDLIERAASLKTASVCIPPCYVKDAVRFSDGRVSVCTVIGFPNGYSTTGSKVYEAKEACDNGASEIDMVINVGFVKAGRYDEVFEEIKLIADAVHEKGAILKVIIETCDLTEDEKIRLCRIVSDAKADFIKTSTGFGSAGAKVEDIVLMKNNVSEDVRIKAAGGIRTVESAREMIENGADRIGASKLGN
ncbi:deoxyribose-phosphate aldolase/phosphopentomutase,TIGR01696 [Ruminococcaceae bacterium R-25]|nr:deoxyribose-phosphate aldolase/phosphopentomutase,TIGR01696 [Ruminococcaceae bacterium R-25]SUQ21858.1 deoxyribose-phosphate aldolase/phosphopentomutase,TIGR01696 [Oscillospiraceae bacterium]